MNKYKLKINSDGMTLTEVSIAIMVMIIFVSLISLSGKFLQVRLKSFFSTNNDNYSLLQNEHYIYSIMEKWSEILSQPSYSKEKIKMLGCRYKSKDNQSIWDTPGISDAKLPSNYKYCIFPSILGESDIEDLINGEEGARPGIYLLYAIPSELYPSSKPIRRIFCRPINFC